MKTINKLLGALIILVILSSCSSVKVTDTWKDTGNSADMKAEKMLVVSVSENTTSRQRFEKDLVNQLNSKGFNAQESFAIFPEISPVKKVAGAALEKVKQKLRDGGVELVMVNVVRDTKHYTKTVSDGPSYYVSPYYGYRYHRGFYGYYGAMNTGPTYSTTTEGTTYVLETIIYDLSQPTEKQLLKVITSEVDNPSTVGSASKDFSKTIVQELLKE